MRYLGVHTGVEVMSLGIWDLSSRRRLASLVLALQKLLKDHGSEILSVCQSIKDTKMNFYKMRGEYLWRSGQCSFVIEAVAGDGVGGKV